MIDSDDEDDDYSNNDEAMYFLTSFLFPFSLFQCLTL